MSAVNGRGRRWSVACGLVAVSTSLVVACGNTGVGTSSGQALTVKFGTAAAADSLGGEGANYFASQVASATGGKIKVKVYPNAELGDTSTVNKAVVSGSIQFTSDDVLDSYVPQVDLLDLAYLFPSATVANDALNSTAMYDLIWNKLESKGLKILGVWPSGFSYLYSTKPVRTVQDMKGLKIRTFVPVVERPEFGAVGAAAANVEYSEVYTSLSTHLIQGVTDPPNLVVPLKWQEPAPYITELNMAYITTPLIVSEKFWKSLDPTLQRQIQSAATKTLAYEEQRAVYWNNKALSTLKADPSVSVTSPALAPFETAVKSAYPAINSEYPGELTKIEAIVAQAKSGS